MVLTREGRCLELKENQVPQEVTEPRGVLVTEVLPVPLDETVGKEVVATTESPVIEEKTGTQEVRVPLVPLVLRVKMAGLALEIMGPRDRKEIPDILEALEMM